MSPESGSPRSPSRTKAAKESNDFRRSAGCAASQMRTVGGKLSMRASRLRGGRRAVTRVWGSNPGSDAEAPSVGQDDLDAARRGRLGLLGDDMDREEGRCLGWSGLLELPPPPVERRLADALRPAEGPRPTARYAASVPGPVASTALGPDRRAAWPWFTPFRPCPDRSMGRKKGFTGRTPEICNAARFPALALDYRLAADITSRRTRRLRGRVPGVD